MLQPLPPLGLLCILAVLWLFLLVGWEMRSPTLPPGGSYRAPSRDLLIRYNAPDTTDQGQNTATVTIELDQRTITATATSDFRIRSGVADIRGRLTDPGLFARVTDGRALLTNPGQPEQVAGVGVVLPSPGSEESLLLPDMSIGLRIVRRTDVPAAFVVEVYQGAERRPQQRIDVGGPIRTVVGANPETVELELLPLSGVEVTVRHMPGQWLLWIALAAFIVGVAGYVRPPAFGALQIGPWQNSRSVIVIQTNRHDILETIEGTMDIAEAPVPSDPADSPNELEASSIA